MSSPKAWSALPLALAMAGCVSMAPTYRVPDPPIPKAWPEDAFAGAADKPGTTATSLAWQDFYTDAGLRKVLSLALEHNRDLRIAALNTEKAQAYYRIQRSNLFPTVSAIGSVSRVRSTSSASGTVTDYTVGLGVSAWEIDFFGRIRSLKNRSLELYLATEQARRSAHISLLSEVANLYLALAADQDSLKFARETLASQETSANLIRRRFEVGISSELDANRAQISLETAREDAARLTSLVAMDRHALNLLVGTIVPAELLPGPLDGFAPFQDIAPGLPSDALIQRPDIHAAENQLKAANANIGAARAAFFPSISLTAGVGTASSELSGLFKSGSGTWAFAPQAILPIFDLGARRANLQAAKADRDIALAQYERTIQSAFREVADTLTQRAALEEQLAAHVSLVKALEKTHALASARYSAGIDGYLSVLDAQRSLYAAQQGLIALRQARYGNQITLYKVLGGGWNRPSQPAAAKAPTESRPSSGG
ncbi:MAG TPA: efflux transporter outer membrane subunit [Geothrix sp.]|nr:efflux transporter outer membrane subunit [Geothrix sp.]